MEPIFLYKEGRVMPQPMSFLTSSSTSIFLIPFWYSIKATHSFLKLSCKYVIHRIVSYYGAHLKVVDHCIFLGGRLPGTKEYYQHFFRNFSEEQR